MGNTYEILRNYRGAAPKFGQQAYALAKGDIVTLSEEDAEFLQADSPGLLRAIKEPAKGGSPKGPAKDGAPEEPEKSRRGPKEALAAAKERVKAARGEPATDEGAGITATEAAVKALDEAGMSVEAAAEALGTDRVTKPDVDKLLEGGADGAE